MKKLPILYHGTDARMVRMSVEQWNEYRKNCLLVIDYLWPFYNRSILETTHLFGNDYMSQHPLFSKALICIGGYKSNNQLYQYGYLGLTNWKQRAAAYAFNSYAGGELGMVAYELYQGAETVGLDGRNPDESVVCAASRIAAFVEERHEPVLFSFDNYDVRLLLTENGHVISNDELEWLSDGTSLSSFRYTGNLTLDLRLAEPLSSIPSAVGALLCPVAEYSEFVTKIKLGKFV